MDYREVEAAAMLADSSYEPEILCPIQRAMIEELSSQATDVKDLGSEDEVMWDKWLSEVVAGTQDNPRQLEVLKLLRCIKDTLRHRGIRCCIIIWHWLYAIPTHSSGSCTRFKAKVRQFRLSLRKRLSTYCFG